jgi:hypothetical protein
MTPLHILKKLADTAIRHPRAVLLNNKAPLVVLTLLLDDPYPLNRRYCGIRRHQD